jgi:DNA-binding HxlR family transcriptional regulator
MYPAGMGVFFMIMCRNQEYFCGLQFVMEIIAGKWKAPVIWMIGEKTLRFGELEKMLPYTARKVIVDQLKELETDGVVNRVVYAQVPPKVEYSLTERGLMLIPYLDALGRWGRKHMDILNEKMVLESGTVATP